jgi:uncharacterized 2Fe-2S/4Fe-4S cluster protein (DUF4445 family)
MAEVEVRFEREGLEGIAAVGAYLVDLAKRFGVRFEDSCVPESNTHYCSVLVKSGSDLLSADSAAETEYFESNDREVGERLACQTRVERPGEIVIMTKEKVAEEPVGEPAADADANEQYRKEFAELPLEKQIANLVRLETIALGETVSFIINSPFKIADKFMDVMAEFGLKKEEREKEAARPAAHTKEAGDPEAKTKKKKGPKPRASS